MKVKNIMFSGFMAVVLAGVCGAASAAEMTGDALVVASKGYVDVKLGNVNTELSEKITALEDANKEGGSVANSIAAAQEAAGDAQDAADKAQSDVNDLAGKMDLTVPTSDLSTALADKEDTANKLVSGDIDLLDAEGKVNKTAVSALVGEDTKFPTVGAAVEIANAKAQEVLANVSEVSANLGGLTTKVGEHTASIQKLEGGEDVTGSVANAIKQSKDYADSLASSYDAAGSATNALNDAKTYTNEKVEALDGRTGTEAADGSYVVQTTETDGVVTVSRQTFDSTISTADNAVHSTVTAPTTAAVVTYVADQMGTVTTQANSVQEQLDQIYKKDGEVESGILPLIQNDLQGQIDAIKNADTGVLAQANDYTDTEVSGLETKFMNETNGTVTAAIKAEADRAKLAEQGLQSAIDTINNEQNGILAQAKDYTDNGLAKLYSNASTCIAASASKHCIMSAHADESGNPVYVWIDLTAPAE